uniref:D,D-carboxypeptidase n=1 Tax=Enterococcus faecalis TaxID=1351 RepID=Q9KHM1_ENTFL|nr:D-Ala-D-Ala carboxypeptidase VanY-G [Enterococcus faecalis]AAF71279.1 D,D-carboxypeptidase [Enterococcus faecalis]
MNHMNMKHRRRKRRRNQSFLFTGILLLVVVSASANLWYGFGNAAKKDSVIEEMPFTITQDGMQAKEEIKKTVLETSYGGKQQVAEENHGNTQNAGTDEAWNLMLVNRDNAIPDNYKVNLASKGGERVNHRIYEPLMEMLNAAREENWGELPMVVSGYRTQEKQQSLYDEKIAKFKKEGYSDSEAVRQAEQWVAVPGHSEHQLGFAVDINGATYDVYLWLQENSYKYTALSSDTRQKTDITGTAEEVWHYRYVGVEAATEMYENGLCLEEYLEKKQSEN